MVPTKTEDGRRPSLDVTKITINLIEADLIATAIVEPGDLVAHRRSLSGVPPFLRYAVVRVGGSCDRGAWFDTDRGSTSADQAASQISLSVAWTNALPNADANTDGFGRLQDAAATHQETSHHIFLASAA